jgi:HEAT repeat protein
MTTNAGVRTRVRRGLVIILVASAAIAVLSDGVPAQTAPDKHVARALAEWTEGTEQGRLRSLARLGRRGERALCAVPLLIDAVRDRNATVRCEAARDLSQIGPAAHAAVPALCSLLRDLDPRVRDAAGEALGSLGRAAEPAIPALIESLRSDPARRCSTSANALVKIGGAAMPALVSLVSDNECALRDLAARALCQADTLPTTAIPLLIGALRTPNRQQRLVVAQGLETFGQDAVGPLVGALGDADALIRAGAAVALGRLSVDAVPAVPALIAALDDSILATEFEERAAPAVPALIDAIREEDPLTGLFAVLALGQIGPDARTAVPALIEWLRSRDTVNVACATGMTGRRAQLPIAAAAAETLGKIGPDARSAVPALVSALADPRSSVA